MNKQIEEMKNNARIYIGAIVEKLRIDGCELWEIDGIVENILNYITIAEDSVVLSREEYEILLSNADSAFQDGLNESRDLYKQEVKEEVRKETAREIFKALYSMRDVYAEHYEYEIRLNEYNLQELAKQYGVEIKE